MQSNKILVPGEIPADEIVLVTAIFKESGSRVEEGDKVLEIETSKTAYQINAEFSGVFHHQLNVGEEVSSGDTLGEIIAVE